MSKKRKTPPTVTNSRSKRRKSHWQQIQPSNIHNNVKQLSSIDDISNTPSILSSISLIEKKSSQCQDINLDYSNLFSSPSSPSISSNTPSIPPEEEENKQQTETLLGKETTNKEIDELRLIFNMLLEKSNKYDNMTAHTTETSNCVKNTQRDIYFYLMGLLRKRPKEWRNAQQMARLRFDKDYEIYQQLRLKFTTLEEEKETNDDKHRYQCIDYLRDTTKIPYIDVNSFLISLKGEKKEK